MSDDDPFGDGYWDDDEGDVTTLGSAAMFSGPQLPPLPAVGRFGDFEILGRLARGGMADIFLAREEAMGMTRHVVLKRILPEYEGDASFQQLFREEGEIATRFYHPNVCHVYEVGEAEGRTFLALEFVYGVTLDTLTKRAQDQGGLPERLAAFVTGKVAAALDYVHRATGVGGKQLNIVHRDVTLANAMVGWDGRVKLLDFGIAKTSGAEGDGHGKFAYMSPEQVRGQAMDARSDVFALGICLYEMLTGQKLYQRDSAPISMQAIVYDPVPSAREVRSELSAEIDAILQRALQKKPSERYQTAAEMREALNELCVGMDEKGVAGFLWRYFDESEREPLPSGGLELPPSLEMSLEDLDELTEEHKKGDVLLPDAEMPDGPAIPDGQAADEGSEQEDVLFQEPTTPYNKAGSSSMPWWVWAVALMVLAGTASATFFALR